MIYMINNSAFKLTLKDLNDERIYICWTKEERKEIFQMILRGASLTELASKLDYDLPTLSEIKNGTVKPCGKVYFYLLKELGLRRKVTDLRISGKSGEVISVKKDCVSPELLGLIHSDGFMTEYKNGRIQFGFCNKERKVIDNFQKLLQDTFKCTIKIVYQSRDQAYYIYVPSIVARILINRFGGKTTKRVILPPLLEEETPMYLRGLFDGDGTIMFYEGKDYVIPTISFSTGCLKFGKQLKELLLRFKFSSPRIRFETRGNGSWWSILMTKQQDVLRFIDLIGSGHPRKKKKMEAVKKALIKRLSPNLPAC